ncbi:MAG: glyoxalase [Roseivirga sp.]|nr:glyoxalase [Roseivirga sp.]
MSEEIQKLYSHYSAIFPVEDVAETIKWYETHLGCSLFFSYGTPVNYAVLSLNDNLRIHIAKKDDDFKPSGRHTAIYIFVHDIEKVFAHMKSLGLVAGKLTTADYGMRDFDITDLNGFRITFGQGS